MFNVNRKLVLIAVPAVLALGAIGYGSVALAESNTNHPVSQAAATETADSSSEQPETGPEQAEPNEPALPGGGHADADNVQADTQQEGVH
jgi:uncharacterized protein HemX